MRLFKRGKIYYIEFNRENKRSLGTGDRREAQELFKLAKNEFLKGKLIKPEKAGQIGMSDFFKKYIESRYDVSHLTLKKDRIALKMFIESVGEKRKLCKLREKHIDKFKMDCIKKGILQVSINSYLRHIRTALNWAYRKKMITKPVPVGMFAKSKRLPKTLTPNERQILSEYAEKHDFEIFRMMEFSLWTGCRREEIKNLVWQDVKTDHIRIIGKGNKERIIPLLEGTKKAMGIRKKSGPVFLQIHLDSISHRFKAIARACGMEEIKFHTLRHSAATRMIESGIRLEIIQKILGHADISTTKIYAQIYDQVVKDEMKKLEW